MEMFSSQISEDADNLLLRFFRERVPYILRLLEEYEGNKSSSFDRAYLLDQILHAIRHTLQMTVKLCTTVQLDEKTQAHFAKYWNSLKDIELNVKERQKVHDRLEVVMETEDEITDS